MITSKSVYIQKYFVLRCYKVTHLSYACLSKRAQSTEGSLIIIPICFGILARSHATLPWHCLPLSALSGNVARSVSLWRSARPQGSQHPHGVFLWSAHRTLFICHSKSKLLHTNNTCILTHISAILTVLFLHFADSLLQSVPVIL